MDPGLGPDSKRRGDSGGQREVVPPAPGSRVGQIELDQSGIEREAIGQLDVDRGASVEMVSAKNRQVRVCVGGMVETHTRRQLETELLAGKELASPLISATRERLADECEPAKEAERAAAGQRQVVSGPATVALSK